MEFSSSARAQANRIAIAVSLSISAAVPTLADDAAGQQPISIQREGSFMAGGVVVSTPGTFNPFNPTPAGQTLSGDHSYVQFHIPSGPTKKNSALMWGSFVGNSWETTPDGRDGFEQLFLRQGWPVYVADRPRMGRSSRTTVGSTVVPSANEEGFFIQFRLGIWPNLYPGSQFPPGQAALNQFNRWALQSVGPDQSDVDIAAGLAIVDQIGPTILFTHSASSLSGYEMAIANPNIKGIVALESTGVVFPEGELPPPIVGNFGSTTGTSIPLADFMKLTKIPIIMEFGDNIPSQPSPYFGLDFWYRMHQIDLQFAAAVNRHGGHVTLVELPALGIRGNTHFSFTDINNAQVAGIIEKFLHDQHLDEESDAP